MKTIISSLACAGALLAVGARAPGLRAADPGEHMAPPPPPERGVETPVVPKKVDVHPAATGKVLLLHNWRVLEGEVERAGDQYRVRRTIGEMMIPAGQVRYLGQSLEDVYAHLCGQVNLQDADEHVRLANWCRQNGLHALAVAEVRAAADLRPSNTKILRLLKSLEQSATVQASAPAPRPAKVEDAGPLPAVDLTAESVGAFATRVQPILMNACASCHATGRGGNFKLIQTYEAGIGNRRTLQRNLAAVIAQVDARRPEMSRLLIKALSVHGPLTQARFRGRQVHAYRALEDWVKQTVANNPGLQQIAAAQQPVPAAEPPTPVANSGDRWGEDRVIPAGGVAPAPPPAARPSEADGGHDEYDPGAFNRQMHPDRFPPTTAPGTGK